MRDGDWCLYVSCMLADECAVGRHSDRHDVSHQYNIVLWNCENTVYEVESPDGKKIREFTSLGGVEALGGDGARRMPGSNEGVEMGGDGCGVVEAGVEVGRGGGVVEVGVARREVLGGGRQGAGGQRWRRRWRWSGGGCGGGCGAEDVGTWLRGGGGGVEVGVMAVEV
ncbi:hypothetical protein CYMTET_36245 [Cymbomonas tetramitiformis]|uniref:Uncharacterized protein n=1 Tax=Cymbomonas tetramitiformis TaxID=36881 RepID=A0AAE0F7N1_9CHLO|nr:hypothetical protein CYMTET_36245 [Cymbomonas tetramitiformis]